MARTAYLRVYQPLESFSAEERDRWLRQGDDSHPEPHLERRWLVGRSLRGSPALRVDDGAFLRSVGGRHFACPWRTRARMLVGLLAFRVTMPDEVADAFVPEAEARRAARELARLEEDGLAARPHMLHANWHVPLRWFAAFDPEERIITEDRHGLRIRYETTLKRARRRLGRALAVLERADVDEDVVEAVEHLLEWVTEFPEDGLLELDYGTVAAVFDAEDLVEDRSAAAVRTCLDALSHGDADTAGRVFSELTERWSAVRAVEVWN